MATKKAASKKTAEATSTPAKSAAKKAAAKKSTTKPSEETTQAAQPAAASHKAKPSHHDVSVQAYLLWERDGKKHGHHDHYWHQAERELEK